MLWRRSYDTPPPPLPDDDEFSQVGDPRYADLPPELLPRTECLKDVLERMLPYWYDAIVPDLQAGRTVLVTAHGNSLRALVKHLDGISDDEIAGLNIPTGIPLRLRAGRRLRPDVRWWALPRPRRRHASGRHRQGGWRKPEAADPGLQCVSRARGSADACPVAWWTTRRATETAWSAKRS